MKLSSVEPNLLGFKLDWIDLSPIVFNLLKVFDNACLCCSFGLVLKIACPRQDIVYKVFDLC